MSGSDAGATLPAAKSWRLPRAGDVSARLARLLAADGPAEYRRAFYALAVVLITFFALTVLQGPCLQVSYGHDDIGFLASAWKVRNGILPHADYHSAFGALFPWVHAAGLWALGPTAAVLPFCNAVVAVALGLLAWAVAIRRLPAALAAGFAATQFVVAISPHLLRFEWYEVSYVGYYNRQCYALVDTLLLLLFLPRRTGASARAARFDGLLAGGILGTMLFMKVSYFMAGVGLCGLSFALLGRPWKRLPWEQALGLGIVFVLCLPLIRFDVAAMLGDLRMAAAARHADPWSPSISPGIYLDVLGEAWIEAALLVIVQSFLRPPWGLRRELPSGTPSWAEFAGVVGVSGFLCMTNSGAGPHSETPLLTSWAFVLLGYFFASRSAVGEERVLRKALRRHLMPACTLLALLWVYTFGSGLAGLCWALSPVPTHWQKVTRRLSPAFHSGPLADLPIFAGGGEQNVVYADKVNDGLRLLRALGGTHRVEALDFVNPFPFAMQWPVTRGGLWCWHFGYSFSRELRPSAEEVFGDTDVVMVPKRPGHEASFDAMMAIYGSYLQERYSVVSESNQWLLLGRQ